MTDKKIFFQTIHFHVKHPETGEEYVRQFVGKSLMSPEDIEKHKSADIHDIIQSIEIDKPYNPYEDEENEVAHKKALQALRNALSEMEDTDVKN